MGCSNRIVLGISIEKLIPLFFPQCFVMQNVDGYTDCDCDQYSTNVPLVKYDKCCGKDHSPKGSHREDLGCEWNGFMFTKVADIFTKYLVIDQPVVEPI